MNTRPQKPTVEIVLVHFGPHRMCHRAHPGQVREQPVQNHEDVRREKGQEDRDQGDHRFPHPAHVQQHHQNDNDHGQFELVLVPFQRQKAEDGVGAAGDGNRNGQHVVDQQRAAGNHAHPGRQQLGGDEVPAAARRKQLDDLRVAGRNDQDRDDGPQADEDAQVGVRCPASGTLPRVRSTTRTGRPRPDRPTQRTRRETGGERRRRPGGRATCREPAASESAQTCVRIAPN